MILYMILDMISCIKDAFLLLFMPCSRRSSPAHRADETEDDREPDRPMDFDEERNYADQLQIKALSQTWTWRKTPRFYPYC